MLLWPSNIASKVLLDHAHLEDGSVLELRPDC